MLILLFSSWVLTALYIVLILAYARGWKLQSEFEMPGDFKPATRISVIIPARNEAENIIACVQSILGNDYPEALYEIIVVDDHSTDGTFDLVSDLYHLNVKPVRLSDHMAPGMLNAYKKKAIETGIAAGTGELIITTDADCIVPPGWLRYMAAAYEHGQPAMIVAPVSFSSSGRPVEIFQSLDFMSMQGITAAAHRLRLGNMCNGANLAFSREAFQKVDGYKDADHLASGDDFLLLNKMQKSFPDKIVYLKSGEAIVTTAPQPDWKNFLQQRIRWASKSGKYDDRRLTAILALVYLFNLSFLLLFAAGFRDHLFWLLGAGILLIKTAAELYFLLPVAVFFKKEKELLLFPLFQPLHITYIITAGLLGFAGGYEWKGRKVR